MSIKIFIIIDFITILIFYYCFIILYDVISYITLYILIKV